MTIVWTICNVSELRLIHLVRRWTKMIHYSHKCRTVQRRVRNKRPAVYKDSAVFGSTTTVRGQTEESVLIVLYSVQLYSLTKFISLCARFISWLHLTGATKLFLAITPREKERGKDNKRLALANVSRQCLSPAWPTLLASYPIVPSAN